MKISYWEYDQYFKDVDFTIIGEGIVGINCALSLRKACPDAKILLLEKGMLPSGASSKNAGFACFGSPTEILDDLKTHTTAEVLALMKMRKDGLDRLLKICGATSIDFNLCGGFELFLSSNQVQYEEVQENLELLNDLGREIFNTDIYENMNQAISNFGFKGVKNLVVNNREGQINTGKMFRKLINLAEQNNITILNGAEVLSYAEVSEHKVNISLDECDFYTTKLFICTNGFSKSLIQRKVEPARAQVLITKPIENLKVKGTFHFDSGYYYFRNVGNRLLLGGGRNLDFKSENTTELGSTQLVTERLTELLTEVILPDTDYKIEMQWAGIMGVGAGKHPFIEQISDNVFCGVKLGGMGVAIGSTVGYELAKLYLDMR